jgi:tetratricopeptide (TPR) repeat protein
MKAEHRKQLETNTLADKIGGLAQSFKEGPSRNALVYGTLVVAVLVLVVIYRWVAANATANDSARWVRLDQVSNTEQADSFIKENPDTEQSRVERFQVARLDLVQGLRDLASLDRDKAIRRVRSAAEAYEKLAGESGNTPQLTREALLNAAKAREGLGEYEQARQLYGRLARDFPQSLMGKAAAEQAKALESPGRGLEQLKDLAKETPADRPALPPPAP